MTNRLVLALPDFSLAFELTTDASSMAVGAVLSQKEHPIAFFSKKLVPSMQSASTYIRELYVITEAVKKWWHYLLGRKFTIYTDQRSIKHLLSQPIQTPDQQKWVTKLMGFDYDIVYKPGTANRVADALSRISLPSFGAITVSTQPWLSSLRDHFASIAEGLQLLHKIRPDLFAYSHYSVHDGLVYFKQRLYIPEATNLREMLLAEYHLSPMGGHSGIKATLARLAASFYWSGMNQSVQQFITTCHTCQQSKTTSHKPYGLLQPLPVPQQTWEDISMDFITHLPNSGGKTAIWVIVDHLTKFAHFIALPRKYSAAYLASNFMSDIYKLHSLP